MDDPHNRRRFLALTGAGVATSLAGCSALNSQSEPNDSSGQDGGNETGGGDPLAGLSDAATTAVVGPDQAAQQELQTLQRELSQEVESGNTTQQEAELQIQQRQQEAIVAAGQDLESTVEETDELTIEDDLADRGVYLLDGSAEAMIDALNEGTVSQLYPGQAFVTTQQQIALQEAAQAQAEGQAQSNETSGVATDGNETSDGGDTAGGNETDGTN